MKRKSGRVVLLFGVLVVVLLAVAAIILLGPTDGTDGGGGLWGPPPPTPTPRPFDLVYPRIDIEPGFYITNTELFMTIVTTTAAYAGDEYLHDLNAVREQVALALLPEGRPVRVDQLGPPGLAQRLQPGKRAFALEVNVLSGIVGHLQQNDHVDLVLGARLDTYLPREFPFWIEHTTMDGAPAPLHLTFPWTTIEPFRLLTVKTAIEDLRVLEIISKTVAPAPQTNVTPTPAPAGLPPGWILILEVTPQQAEVLFFALEEDWPLQLMLRPYSEPPSDQDPTATTGITTWLLLDANGPYRMPMPRIIAHPITPGSLPRGIVP